MDGTETGRVFMRYVYQRLPPATIVRLFPKVRYVHDLVQQMPIAKVPFVVGPHVRDVNATIMKSLSDEETMRMLVWRAHQSPNIKEWIASSDTHLNVHEAADLILGTPVPQWLVTARTQYATVLETVLGPEICDLIDIRRGVSLTNIPNMQRVIARCGTCAGDDETEGPIDAIQARLITYAVTDAFSDWQDFFESTCVECRRRHASYTARCISLEHIPFTADALHNLAEFLEMRSIDTAAKKRIVRSLVVRAALNSPLLTDDIQMALKRLCESLFASTANSVEHVGDIVFLARYLKLWAALPKPANLEPTLLVAVAHQMLSTSTELTASMNDDVSIMHIVDAMMDILLVHFTWSQDSPFYHIEHMLRVRICANIFTSTEQRKNHSPALRFRWALTLVIYSSICTLDKDSVLSAALRAENYLPPGDLHLVPIITSLPVVSKSSLHHARLVAMCDMLKDGHVDIYEAPGFGLFGRNLLVFLLADKRFDIDEIRAVFPLTARVSSGACLVDAFIACLQLIGKSKNPSTMFKRLHRFVQPIVEGAITVERSSKRRKDATPATSITYVVGPWEESVASYSDEELSRAIWLSYKLAVEADLPPLDIAGIFRLSHKHHREDMSSFLRLYVHSTHRFLSFVRDCGASERLCELAIDMMTCPPSPEWSFVRLPALQQLVLSLAADSSFTVDHLEGLRSVVNRGVKCLTPEGCMRLVFTSLRNEAVQRKWLDILTENNVFDDVRVDPQKASALSAKAFIRGYLSVVTNQIDFIKSLYKHRPSAAGCFAEALCSTIEHHVKHAPADLQHLLLQSVVCNARAFFRAVYASTR